jgi:hypothetical protein
MGHGNLLVLILPDIFYLAFFIYLTQNNFSLEKQRKIVRVKYLHKGKMKRANNQKPKPNFRIRLGVNHKK